MGMVQLLGRKRLWLILTITGFHFFNLYSWLHADWIAKAPLAFAESPAVTANLTCEQTVRLMQWGKGRSRHASGLDLESREFSDKTLEAFLEKLDTQRLLFTANEVKHFTGE